MLFHYLASGDDRLARQAIIAYASSVQPDGLVLGRYPAHGTQVITGFALFWVLQVCDHHLYFNDSSFTRNFLSIIHSVFDYFQRHIGENGLVTGLPSEYWSFVDWADDWEPSGDFPDPGVPPAGRTSTTWSYFSMLYLYALRQVIQLLPALGVKDLPPEYETRVSRLVKAIKDNCFDGEFFNDSLVGNSSGGYSSHAQIWAVLSGVTEGDQALERRIVSAALSPGAAAKFVKPSYTMIHYAFRALAQTNLYTKLYDGMWEPWRIMLSQNLTTWAEDDVTSRSDCHEWSSLQIYEYAIEVAGLSPLQPGWQSVRFAPRFTLQESLEAKINLGNRGLATIKWSTHEKTVTGVAEFPENVSVISPLQGVTSRKTGSREVLEFTVNL